MATGSIAHAATIRVPSDQPNIQIAINFTALHDTVLVADGVFTGPGNRDIDFKGKPILVRSERGADYTIIDCQGDSLDPHRGFVFRSGQDSNSVLQGFTIINGFGKPDCLDYTFVHGGAIYCFESSPLIRDCVLKNNTCRSSSDQAAGGGVSCVGSSPILVNVSFVENSVVSARDGAFGGGLSCTLLSRPRLITCTFVSNEAHGIGATAVGGAVYQNITERLKMTSCTLRGNISSSNIFAGGGAICSYSSMLGHPLILEECVLDSNSATNAGGGLLHWVGEASAEGCVFSRNSADVGGAWAAIGYTDALLSGCTLYGNHSNQSSGIALSGSGLTIENSIVAFGETGEAIGSWNSSSTPQALPSDSRMQPASDFDGRRLVHLSCTDIYGNEGGDWVGIIAGQAGTNGNLSADPLFCDTANGIFAIDPYSPCAPDNNSCGELIGALSAGCFVCGDVTGDWDITISDVLFLGSYYFEYGPPPLFVEAGDVNCDGQIGLTDVIYLADFLFRDGEAPCCP